MFYIYGMNINEIPLAIVLEHSQKYTPAQMQILYGDVSRDDGRYKLQIKNLYEKADKLNDNAAMEILSSRYDMTAIFENDISGLPQVTKEQTDKAFDEIYNEIKKINPYVDQYQINKRDMRIRKLYSDNKRRRMHGSTTFQSCFKIVDNKVYFSLRSYLYKTSTENVKMIARAMECPKEVLTYIVPDLIDWCLKQPFIKEEVISFLRLFPDNKPIPLEDIVDMENGKIIIIKESINTIK